MIIQLVLLLTFASASNAYTIFDTSCTTPNQTTNFVRSPDSRGTLDVLWPCLLTIVACTWTVQHLNIPEQRNGRDDGWKGDFKWKLKSFWRSSKWMLITMVAPEFLISKFWQDLAIALIDFQAIKKFSDVDRVDWTLTHSLFADMGGFVIIGNAGTAPETLQKTDIRLAYIVASKLPMERETELESTIRQTSLEQLNAPITPSTGLISQLHNDPFHLTTTGIYHLRKSGLLSKLPCITIDEINDKSKSDGFARTISVLQIGWIVAQVIIRASKSLAISQLEIAVVAFSASAIVIYALAWLKPKDVSIPYTLMSFPDDIPPELIDATMVHRRVSYAVSMLTGFFGINEILTERPTGASIPNDSSTIDIGDTIPLYNWIGMALGCMIFGGIHLSAWNFAFPTEAELILWRATSLYCTVFVLLHLLVLVLFNASSESGWPVSMCTCILCTLYVFARLFLVVEMFRTLLFLPPDAYKSF